MIWMRRWCWITRFYNDCRPAAGWYQAVGGSAFTTAAPVSRQLVTARNHAVIVGWGANGAFRERACAGIGGTASTPAMRAGRASGETNVGRCRRRRQRKGSASGRDEREGEQELFHVRSPFRGQDVSDLGENREWCSQPQTRRTNRETDTLAKTKIFCRTSPKRSNLHALAGPHEICSADGRKSRLADRPIVFGAW